MRYWKTILIILLAVYALPVFSYIVFGTLDSNGAKDFHQFWYAGHFILRGQDPYQAFFAEENLPVRQPGLEITPSNSPLLLLVLSIFSLLAWPAAKIVWVCLNLFLACLSFWLIVEKLPFPNATLDRQAKILLFFLYFDLSPTRIAIENGQTTLLVLALMLAAILLARRSWLLAGILLGLALSKYSVSLSVALFFLIHRDFRVLATALLSQFLGFVGLSIISGNSVALVFAEYYYIFISLMNQRGIHLSTLIPGTQLDILISVVMTLALALCIYYWLIRKKTYQLVDSRILDFHLLTIFMLWSLVVAYHRLYDALLLLLLMTLVFKAMIHTGIWNLSLRMRAVVAWGLGIGLALLTIPARIVGFFLPGMYGLLTNEIPGMILLVFLSALMFLFHRFLFPPILYTS